MLPSNVDPRRPDKVHRLKSKTSNSKPGEATSTPTGNGQAEDLTPDYMNILGQQHATTANAVEGPGNTDKHADGLAAGAEPDLPSIQPQHADEKHVIIQEDASEGVNVVPVPSAVATNVVVTTNATNVIPTSPQYGVAIITNPVPQPDMITENVTPVTESVVDTTAKPPDDPKDIHTTPSRNDRFKVVKIASLEPFKRGRWKCMDYVDEAPPPTLQQTKVTQSTGSIQLAGGVYFQTQSLPQQQIQQMLLQGGFTNGTQFVPTQMIPQGQYFYPQVSAIQTQTLPQQLVNSTGVPSSMPAQFINTSQTYFPAGVVPNAAGGFTIPQSYPNIQYVPANMLQNQNSAFVPTSQGMQLSANFQQSQTYAGQPNVSQGTVTQPLVNGHAFPPQNDQVTSSSLPTQTAKNVILTTNNAQPGSQSQMNQSNVQNQMPQGNSQSQQSVPVIQNQQFQQLNQNFQQVPGQQKQTQSSSQVQGVAQTINTIPVLQAPSLIQMPQVVSVPSQTFDQSLASNVYTNPQFAMSVNSLTILENNENSTETVGESGTGTEATGDNPDDLSKTNPVVNAIDNKIEQAMDLVKSHLMYTVREEVEVLKEKIAELMERIQQLETENNFLRSQIPKNQAANPTASVAGVNPPVSNTTGVTMNPAAQPVSAPSINPTPPINNVPGTGMIFSMCGLMMRLKWCAWVALYCSCISFANSRLADDTKQILSSFMLSISAIVMSYLQNPQPMSPPWAAALQ